MKAKSLHFQSLTRKGRKSPENEDYLSIPDPDASITGKSGCLFVLCDGMGGHNAGEVASRLCVEFVREGSGKALSAEDPDLDIRKLIADSNNKLRERSAADPKLTNMGTTLVILFLKDGLARVYNVGDSRIYLFSGGRLTQLTEDHSPVWQMYRDGSLSKDEILRHPRKNLISQAMGLHDELEIFHNKIDLPQDYLFLLCSDGLTDYVADSEISTVLEKALSLEQALNDLYRLSQEKGSYDDVSLILVSNYLK